MIHELKCHPIPFRDVVKGLKSYEIRVNDRGFTVGDSMLLREWDPLEEKYTGSELAADVVHMIEGSYGLPPGLCVMGISVMDIHDEAETNEGT